MIPRDAHPATWPLTFLAVRTLLVTGGAGFIGSNFMHGTSWRAGGSGARVVNLDKLTYAGQPRHARRPRRGHPRYAFVHGDIVDAKLAGRNFSQSHPFTAVVHFAAESHVDRSIDSPEDFLITNVLGTFRLLEAARRRYWKTLPAVDAATGVPLSACFDRRGLRLTDLRRTGFYRGNRPSRQTARMPRARRAATTSPAPIFTPTGCRWSRRTARTITGRFSSRKSSSR